jgi:hypothetical protein
VIRTAEIFAEICEALWGEHWISPASHELKLHRNTLGLYTTQDKSRRRRIPPETWDRLLDIWESRSEKFGRLNAIVMAWRA